MIRTAICDDEANIRTYLSALIRAQSCPCEIVEYASAGDFLANHREFELQNQFFRIHKGYLVNLSYVDGYSKTEVTLTNGETLLLSKYKYQDFVKAYLHFLKREKAFFPSAVLMTLLLVFHALLPGVMLYIFQRQIRKQRFPLRKQELCYISFVPSPYESDLSRI